jgi:cytochrome P450
VSWQDPWWLPLQPLFDPLKSLPLPSAWLEWITYSKLGWALEHRYNKHLEVGPIFAIVSPRKTEFVVADPTACEELLSQWKVWTKSPELYKLFEVFGVNVNTASVDEWPRHRKIVSHGFKENNVKMVWETSLRQAAHMARAWETKSKTVGEVFCRDLESDSGMFSLLILAAALWGEEHDFGDEGLGGRKAPPGHKMSYKDALKYIMDQILLVLMFDALVLPSWLMPGPMKKLKVATNEYRMYLQEKIDSERSHLSEGGSERANLGAILVAANEKAKSEDPKFGLVVKGYLTDEELFGNFFMLNLAGHETTATSVSFALALLGSHLDVQTWVREEVDAVFDASTPYSEIYSRLARVSAVMYETLRIYGAVQNLNKYSRDGHDGQPLVVGDRTYLIPASSYVAVNFQGVHTSPEYWGENSLEWKPQRWVTASINEKNSNTFGEHLGGPPKGAAFVAWALGPRECPGKKFSKVEFVALIAYLLKNFEIKPAVRDGETEQEAARRLYGVVHDCQMTLAPRFRRPDDAGIVLKAR